MKFLITFLFALSCFTIATAQKTSPIPLKDGNYKAELISKLKSNPVAKVIIDENNKAESKIKLFKKKMNPNMPDGSTILAAKVVFTDNGNHPFLARTYKKNDKSRTHFIPLTIKGNKMFVDFKSNFNPVECLMMRCTTCDAQVSQTGMVYCECAGGETGDCAEPDVSYPNHVVLDQLFR